MVGRASEKVTSPEVAVLSASLRLNSLTVMTIPKADQEPTETVPLPNAVDANVNGYPP
jgi:hypothetical protein